MEVTHKQKGSDILRDNFIKAISNIFQWYITKDNEKSDSDSYNASFNNEVSI